ncbi:tRNA1(Val) (adenine(37)-N6)-methyltransferase [Natranaerovirga hydrolytica]|nr:tRNA1(Val) (adenine(37)-N6)-methyltransferase [Natranaerovirga hydrolytica]
MQVELKDGERIDNLERNNYRIIQHPKGFCFGMDAVLLTGFVDGNTKGKVLDLGTGTGIIPILLEAKTQADHFTGLEIQDQSVDMAKRSIQLNNLENKIQIIKGDIKNAFSYFPLASFDIITSNPPYMINNSGYKNINEPKTIARHEILCNLEDVIKASSKLVKVGGKVYFVHRPNRLTEMMVLMKSYQLEPKRIRFVHPYHNKPANMVLIEGIRHGKSLVEVEKPLIVYEKEGTYTQEIYDIYGMTKGETYER